MKEEAVSKRKGMGDKHRRVNSTKEEGDVKARVIFAEEKGKEIVKPKKYGHPVQTTVKANYPPGNSCAQGVGIPSQCLER